MSSRAHEPEYDPCPAITQAGGYCENISFQAFLGVPPRYHGTPTGATFAAYIVQGRCGVFSRAQFRTDSAAASDWNALFNSFQS